MAKKRNVQDLTLINLHAMKRQIAKQRTDLDSCARRVKALERTVIKIINALPDRGAHCG